MSMDNDLEIRGKLFERARNMTLKELPDFLDELSKLPANYNTAVYTVAAAGVAASWAMNDVVGLSGFQAGCVMWEYMEFWIGVKAPARLVRYENMLYPQYKNEFDKTFSAETWTWLKQEAKKGVDEWMKGNDSVSPRVLNHWLRIVSGEKPFGYITEEEYRNLPAPPALETQADVLKAWKEGKLKYNDRWMYECKC